MKSLLKYLGILIILIGAVVLIVATLNEASTNLPLAIGGAAITLGLIVQVFVGRRIE